MCSVPSTCLQNGICGNSLDHRQSEGELTENPTLQAQQSSFRLPVTHPIGTDVNKPVRLSPGVVVELATTRKLPVE
jgi:hypothetical protein